jgi:hypothetical protein
LIYHTKDVWKSEIDPTSMTVKGWFKPEFVENSKGVTVNIIHHEGLPNSVELVCVDEEVFVWHKLRWKEHSNPLDPDLHSYTTRETNVDPASWGWY